MNGATGVLAASALATSVLDTAASPRDMIDVMTRLDTAIRSGRPIGSFGVKAP